MVTRLNLYVSSLKPLTPILFLLLAIVACGGDSNSNSNSEFAGALPEDIVSIDPHKSQDLSGDMVKPLIYEGLVAIGPDGKWKGVLAESWDTSADGLTWTFHLRSGVKFHNGRAMTSDDVVYSFNRVLDPNTGASQQSVLVQSVKMIQKIDPDTVQIELNYPDGAFLAEIGIGVRVAIIAKESVNTDGTIDHPIGTGPYQFVSWQPGGEFKAQKFVDYWGQKSDLDTVRFVVIKDPTARLGALQSGEVQWIQSLPFDTVNTLTGTSPSDLSVQLVSGNETLRINFNSTRPPLNDVRVRKAVALAIDKHEINDAVFSGAGTPHNQPFADDSFLHLDVQDAYALPNLDEARRLLAEAGYGTGLKLTVIHPQGIYPGLWETIAQELQRVGISIDLQIMDVPQFLQRAQALDFDMDADEQSSIFHWDRTFAYFEASSNSNWLVGGYNNPALTTKLDAARREVDLEKARTMYTDILRLLQDDAACIFLMAVPQVQVHANEMSNFSANPSDASIVWPGGGLNYAHLKQ